MSTRITFGTISEPYSLSSGVYFASDLSEPQKPLEDHETPRAREQRPSNPGLAGHSAPRVDAHPDAPRATQCWRKNLGDHLAGVFRRPDLNDVVARALHIVEPISRTKVRVLAEVVCTQWTHIQYRYKDVDARAPEIVALVSKMADHLGRLSVHAHKDFLDALDAVCVARLKRTWDWYFGVVSRGISPMYRTNLFMRVMAAVAMSTRLFHGGLLRHDAVLDGFGHFARISPHPDAIAIVYAILHRLGPEFALERTGRYFIQRLLCDLSSTVNRSTADPLCQLVSAIKKLVEEWQNPTRVTLYETYPKGNH